MHCFPQLPPEGACGGSQSGAESDVRSRGPGGVQGAGSQSALDARHLQGLRHLQEPQPGPGNNSARIHKTDV